VSVSPLPIKNKFDPAQDIVRDPKASQYFRDYMSKLDALITALASGQLPPLTNAANDAAAAAAGVQVGFLYRNGSVLMQRQV
jgi:hypothetical protein